MQGMSGNYKFSERYDGHENGITKDITSDVCKFYEFPDIFGMRRVFPDMPCMKRVYRDRKASLHCSTARNEEGSRSRG